MATAKECHYSIPMAETAIDLCIRARIAIETYLGRDVGDSLALSALYGRLQTDFGITPREADCLDLIHLSALLVNLNRLRNPGAASVQEILGDFARLRSEAASFPASPESMQVYIKALDRFPDPTPLETGQPIGTATKAEVPQPPASHVVEPSSPPTPAKPRRKRDEDKAKVCVGIYMDAITRSETPPSLSEIARMARCDKGTASRAIAPLEAKRAELAKEDARRRYGNVD
jgi:hypothetical protein